MYWIIPENNVNGAYMGPTWGPQNPGGPHLGHVNIAIWDKFPESCDKSNELIGRFVIFASLYANEPMLKPVMLVGSSVMYDRHTSTDDPLVIAKP